MPRANRLLQLVCLLGGRRPRSMAELVERFGVSDRTLYRDLDDLGRCNIPVTRIDGGYRLVEGATLRPLRLTAEEHAVLRLALESPVLRGSSELADRLATLEAKLDAITSQTEETPAALALASVDRSGETPMGLMPALETAIAERRAMSLRYASLSGGAETWRGIDPYQLFHRGDAWYLVGRCHVHDGPRTFRLDRIRELRPLGMHFQVPEEFSLDGYLETAWTIYRGETTHEVILRFDAALAPLIKNARHHPSEEVSEVADGDLEYRVHVSHLDEIARWILGFGGRCRVVEPDVLRRQVVGLADGAWRANSVATADDDLMTDGN